MFVHGMAANGSKRESAKQFQDKEGALFNWLKFGSIERFPEGRFMPLGPQSVLLVVRNAFETVEREKNCLTPQTLGIYL